MGSLQGFDSHVRFVTQGHEWGGVGTAEGERWHSGWGGSERAFQPFFCAAEVGSGPLQS